MTIEAAGDGATVAIVQAGDVTRSETPRAPGTSPVSHSRCLPANGGLTDVIHAPTTDVDDDDDKSEHWAGGTLSMVVECDGE